MARAGLAQPQFGKASPISLRRHGRFLSFNDTLTYFGADSRDAIALANTAADRQPTKFAAWTRANSAVRQQPDLVRARYSGPR